MMKRVSHKILAWILGICLIVGLIPLSSIMADEDSISGTGTVSYVTSWKDSSTINLSITPTTAGTAYYLVQDSESASSADIEVPTDLTSSGTPVTCKAGETTVEEIGSTTTSARVIFVSFVDNGGNTYDTTTLSLPAYSETSSADGEATLSLTGTATVEAKRTSASQMSMTLTATYSGTFYYILQDADTTAPTLDDVVSSGMQITYNSSDSSTVVTVSGLSTDEETLYVVYKDNSGLLTSELKSVDVPG